MEWCALSFELHMNVYPHSLPPIVVNLHKYIQQYPDKFKHQCPKKDNWLYFPPHCVQTTYIFHDGKKKISRRITFPKHLNNTSCIKNDFTVMSNGFKPSNANFSDSTHQHHEYTIWYSGHGCTGRKNPIKKQKHEKSCQHISRQIQI